ncbi:hypothetical protein CPB83DRAFT_855815 [Crepidotus variabilis]|uniref:Uncharacterized protein n=1 Tax=Crepidotus variabilis TaxID=179855 RepID=A0A9P6EDW9_9AGAR|nr:hypothetical protein CPB83DRAFT_855815 [Crepidotus variabilis]
MSLGFKPPALSTGEILRAACYTTSALSRHKFEACLFGSVAGLLHGMDSRAPKDVDLFILNSTQDQDDEAIKDLLVQSEPERFFLVDSLTVGATHRVLWFNVDDPQVNSSQKQKVSSSKSASATSGACGQSRRVCKIDILSPQMLGLPPISSSELQYHPTLSYSSLLKTTSVSDVDPEECPVAFIPLFPLILLKLRAWEDHSLPNARDIMRDRVPQDEDDIEELLCLASTGNKSTLLRQPAKRGKYWSLGGFQSPNEAERCIRKYVEKWPRSVKRWRAIGFM